MDVLWLVIPVLLIGLSSYVSVGNSCSSVDVNLHNTRDNHFLNEERLVADLEEELGFDFIGDKLIHNHVNLVENHIKSNKFVKDAVVLSDHKGRLQIDVFQERPVARIVNPGNSYYLTESGSIMPSSINYSSRVMVIEGSVIDELLLSDSVVNNEDREMFCEFINYIHQDEFLKAQVASIEVGKDMKLVIYPQVTKQRIEFGTCENYVDKLWKLKVFYRQILPRKGWNSYDRVNLEFENQIICE